MNINQQSAIDLHRAELCGVLKATTEAFLFNLQMKGILSPEETQTVQGCSPLEGAKILRSLDILKHKVDGFSAIISYLRQNNLVTMEKMLESSAVSAKLRGMTFNDQLEISESKSKFLVEKLKGAVVKFYLGNFRAVESFRGDSEHIESVWVDIQMKGDQSSTANYSDIFIRMSNTGCHSTIVEGQPGSGKTTLVKKIAYDWAKHKSNQNDKKIPFDLILAVPLRSVQSGADLLEVAVRYLMSETISQAEVEAIVAALRHSDLTVLLILDGLDEWEIQSSSPLAKIFGSAANRADNKLLVDKIDFDFDLMITSRPYACELINENFLPTRWRIVGLNKARQSEFVKLRCRTQSGRNRATDYLKNSTVLREIGEIPLLLLLVCYLADENIKLPTNLTRLYELLVRRMLIRSANKGSIGKIYQKDWRKSELVASLGRLALLGVVKNKFELSGEEMEMCQIEEETFKSGLLLFRSDPVNLRIKADFAHRSIQEFLAALHCVDFWAADSTITSTTGWPEEIWPIVGISEMNVEMLVAKMIPIGDSQFCRFYFGLLSGQPELEVKMRKSLEEYLEVYLIVPSFLLCLSNSLADCTDAECFLSGEIVNGLVDRSFNRVKSGWTEVQLRKKNIFRWTEEKTMDNRPKSATTELRPQLQSGLKLKWLANSPTSFYLRSESQTELKMIRIWLDEENLADKVGELDGFEQVEWLWIYQVSFGFDQLRSAVEVIKRLPKCRNCRITDLSAGFFLIRMGLGRKSEFPVNSGHSGVKPEFILFQVKRNLGDKILTKLSSLRQSDSGEVEIQSIQEDSNFKQAYVRLVVSSSWSVWNFLRSEAEWC